MRWTEQEVEAAREGRLPGFKDPTVVRTFKAPDSLDVRFHEVQAKSALNRVPGAGTRLPFRWTINPYRGCLHACTFCAEGSTPILMGDGRTRALADLRPGDEIYGTRLEGRYRRYARTRVLDHWSVVKPAFRTMLADGTELITSGDHRFLAERGWKHVAGAMAGSEQRPCLTTDDSLMGTGRFAVPPECSPDYRRGYLCGVIRGDGNLASYSYEGAGRRRSDVHGFRLALADDEALVRAQEFLRRGGVLTDSSAVSAGAPQHRPLRAIRTQARDRVDAIRDLIRWPLSPSDDWRKGFLAGIFDAEGSCTASTSALRIPNTDTSILRWTEACFRHFDFDVVVVDCGGENGLATIRLRGGLREQLRFFHLTDPAISRTRDLDGMSLQSEADLRVVSVQPLGFAMRLYDITTGTGDFIANGVVSHNCFARPTHEFLDLDAGRDFEREIVVKVNAPEVLRAELGRKSWKGEHVALGTNTDPYQWVEKRYGITRSIWEVMRDFANPCSVLTKSPLLLRDIDLFEELVALTRFHACLSITTLDEKAWRDTEPHTPHPKARMEAVAELNGRGIPTGILIAPVMPGINDAPEQIEAVVEAAHEAGASSIGGQALFLRGSTKGVFMDSLRERRPELVQMYERLYGNRAYLTKDEKARVEAPLVGRRKLGEARFSRPPVSGHDRVRTSAEIATGARVPARAAPAAAAEEPVQQRLF